MPETAEIDIHDLILNDDVQEQEEPRRRERAKRPNVEYEVALSSGTDFAIRRKTQRTERLLVCLVSQEQYYIKDSDGSVKQLDVDNMTDFMSDLYDDDENGIKLPECSWTTMVPKGKKRCEVFLEYISNRQLMELAKNNLIMIDSYEYARYGAGAIRAFRMLTDMSRHHDARAMTSWCMGEMERKYGMTRHEVLLDNNRYEDGKPNITDMVPMLCEISEHLGEDVAHRVFSNCLEMHHDIPFSPDMFYESWTYKFEPSAFVEYITYGAMQQGYIDEGHGFYNNSFTADWGDTLKMQMDLYGKIREKYPKNLKSLHHRLAYLARVRKTKISEEEWKRILPAMLEREWTDGKYLFVAPHSPADMLDEANQQSNCLAGYITRVANGKTQIFFMRHRARPSESYITIEVTEKGELGQVFGGFNRSPSKVEYDEVVKWATRCGLKVPEQRARMHA